MKSISVVINSLALLTFGLGCNVFFVPSIKAQVLTFDTTDSQGGGNNSEILEVYYNDTRLLTQVGEDPPQSSVFSTHTNDLGDFTIIGELNQNTGIGNILEVVVYQSGGNNGTETGSGTIQDFLDTLAQPGVNNAPDRVTQTTSLVFGLGINETGGSPIYNVDALEIKLQIPGSGCATETLDTVTAETCTFALGDVIQITNNGGNNDAEIRFQADLNDYLTGGNDFFSTYGYSLDGSNNLLSAGTSASYNYFVSSLVGNNTAGNDRLFLSGSLTSVAENVPFKFSPGLGLVLCGGFFGGLTLIKKSQNQTNV